MNHNNEIAELTPELEDLSKRLMYHGCEINTENERLLGWIHNLTRPFRDRHYSECCVQIYSILDVQGRKVLKSKTSPDLLRIDFPTNLYGLYRGESEPYDLKQQGRFILSRDYKAQLYFPDYDGVHKDKGAEYYHAGWIEGDCHDLAKRYLKYIQDLIYVGSCNIGEPLRLTEGSIQIIPYFDYAMYFKKLLLTLLPSWIEEARFSAETIDIFLTEDFSRLSDRLRQQRPFLYVVSGRNDNYVSGGLRRIAQIPCSWEQKIKTQIIVDQVEKVISEMLTSSVIMKEQREKFNESFPSKTQLGQGDGLSGTLRIDFDTMYYHTFFSISFGSHFTPA